MIAKLNFNHDPPWKAVLFFSDDPNGGIWAVTSDRANESDEYDLFEDPTEDEAKLAAASPELLIYAMMEDLISQYIDRKVTYEEVRKAFQPYGIKPAEYVSSFLDRFRRETLKRVNNLCLI